MTPTEARAAWAAFTPEERLAMAKTAPKVARWTDIFSEDDAWVCELQDVAFPILWIAKVRKPSNEDGPWLFVAKLENGDLVCGRGYSEVLAKKAAFGVVAAGYVLDDGGAER